MDQLPKAGRSSIVVKRFGGETISSFVGTLVPIGCVAGRWVWLNAVSRDAANNGKSAPLLWGFPRIFFVDVAMSVGALWARSTLFTETANAEAPVEVGD